ncbi:MAG: IS3 family transposase [Chloroflexota bacterium]|nr:IS3 family transposase [Chloroflexota bacterium]
MARTIPFYPPEFKIEAVHLVQQRERSLAQVARDLGVSEQTLRNWVKQIEVDSGMRAGLTTEERDELRRLRRENRILKEERDILKKAGGLLRQGEQRDPLAAFAFIEAEKAHHPVAMLARVLGMSRSGYYAWCRRPPSARAEADHALGEQICAIHAQSRAGALWAGYGMPRIHAELRATGIGCGRKRVARLLRAAGLTGCHRRKGTITTRRGVDALLAADRVQRDFTAIAPNRLWVADITYIPTWMGFLSLAVVLDVFSRRVVGWAMADHLRAELVVDALDMAIARRRPAAGVIHHSDHGSQYTSLTFGQRLHDAGIVASRGSRGDCYDNALMESFFATLECELLDGRPFPTHRMARTALFEFLEGFYNRRRRHSALGYLSPFDFERRWTSEGQVA